MKINYFDSVKDYPEMQPYDQTFHFEKDYNPKLKRDDMKYTQVSWRRESAHEHSHQVTLAKHACV